MRILSHALILLLTLLVSGVQAASLEKISFTSGTNRLSGLLATPDRVGAHPIIVFVAGDGAVAKEAFSNPDTNRVNQQHKSVGDWNRFLSLGFACFAWDRPGVGESEGDWTQSTVFDRADELIAAVDYLTNRADIDKSLIGLWGISQAGWVMPRVAAQVADVKFVIAVSCPAQTIVEESAYLLEKQLLDGGTDPVNAAQARDLYLRKWIALRSGVSFAEATRVAAQNQKSLPAVQHEWLQPFTADQYQSLSTNRSRLESFFYNPLRHLTEINVPVLALFGGQNRRVNPGTGIAGYRQALERAGNDQVTLKEFPQVDHAMAAAGMGGVSPQPIPEYWASIREFVQTRFPAVPARGRPIAKQTDTKIGDLKIRQTFHDRRALAYESGFDDLIRRSIGAYTNLFGGLPKKQDGQVYDYIDFDIYYGNLTAEADPQYVSIDVGPQQVFGYLNWQTLLAHELFHLWNAETFRYKDHREQWFNEGATEYYAIKHSLRFGVLDRAQAVDIWSRSLALYLSANGTGSISMREAGQQKLKRDHYFLIYHGGLLTCLILDLEIRELTRNERSLDDLMRWLYQNSNRTDKLYDLDRLVFALKELTGTDFTPFFSRHVHGTDILPVGKYLSRMELEAIRQGKLNEIEPLRRKILRAVLELE
jgi:pimeloyl-ACP methyl ester carboxylesterase